MWVWVSVMNPHTQGWGFATQLPFAMIIAVVTMASMLLSRTPKGLPMTPVSVLLLLFVLWMNVTTPFALLPGPSWVQWNKVMKIMLMSFVVMMLIRTRADIVRLVWVLVGLDRLLRRQGRHLYHPQRRHGTGLGAGSDFYRRQQCAGPGADHHHPLDVLPAAK